MNTGSEPTLVLRIHGVGGERPEQTLAVEPREMVLVAGAPPTGFWARRADRATTAYSWGRLTSGSGFYALWLVLLPFTVANVAGWMHAPVPPGGGARALRRLRATRALVMAFGACLTASWVVWGGVIVVDVGAFQWLARVDGFSSPRLRVVAGSLVLGIAGAVVVVIAGVTQRGFERVGASGDGADRRWRADDSLAEPSFFDHAPSAARLLLVHVGVVVGMAWAVFCRAWVRMDDGVGRIDFAGWVWALAAVEGVLILVLVAVSLRSPKGAGTFRWRPVAVASALSFGLLHGFFTTLAFWAARTLNKAGKAEPAAPPRVALGSELALFDVYALAVVVTLVFASVWVLHLRASRPVTSGEVPINSAGLGLPIDGVPDEGFLGKVAAARGMATVPANLDVVLSIGTATLMVAGVAAAVNRTAIAPGAWWHPWAGWTIEVGKSWLGMRGLAQWALPTIALGAVGLVQQTFSRPGLRRSVAQVWDVLTFWPRRHHPLAVRPYAERAVPELRAHLTATTCARPVVVAAHSQGAVLACAALASLPERVTRRVALVTFGSPVQKLFGRAFPAYFSPSSSRALRWRLAPPLAETDRWRNYHRLTDPIGGPVFGDDDPADIVVADPATGPPVSSTPEEPAPPEPLRQPWATLAVHSYYFNEPSLQNWMETLQTALPTGPGDGGPGASRP